MVILKSSLFLAENKNTAFSPFQNWTCHFTNTHELWAPSSGKGSKSHLLFSISSFSSNHRI